MNLTEVSQTCTDLNVSGSGGTLTCQVNCPAGYVVMTGGFECLNTGTAGATPTDTACDSTIYIKNSKPLASGAGWEAMWRNPGGSSISVEVETFAYCAIIQGCSPANLAVCAPPEPP
jgi:hypothetical protein